MFLKKDVTNPKTACVATHELVEKLGEEAWLEAQKKDSYGRKFNNVFTLGPNWFLIQHKYCVQRRFLRNVYISYYRQVRKLLYHKLRSTTEWQEILEHKQ